MLGIGDASGMLPIDPATKNYSAEMVAKFDDLVEMCIRDSFNYDAYGYGVYYDTIHGDISASNPLLVNNLLQRNTREMCIRDRTKKSSHPARD